ncbi:MAG: hypothetical protein MZV49_18080 [Rhodopseudomonas palustris]|nr:hypothetical protein [Rhodopseudomonas palustris]
MAIAARIGPEPDRFGGMRRMHRLLRFAGWRACACAKAKQAGQQPANRLRRSTKQAYISML